MEDSRRGLHSDEAWRTRLAKSRFLKEGLQDTSAPVIQLEPLTSGEVSKLLQRLAEVHAIHYNSKKALSAREVEEFQKEVAVVRGRLAAWRKRLGNSKQWQL